MKQLLKIFIIDDYYYYTYFVCFYLWIINQSLMLFKFV